MLGMKKIIAMYAREFLILAASVTPTKIVETWKPSGSEEFAQEKEIITFNETIDYA